MQKLEKADTEILNALRKVCCCHSLRTHTFYFITKSICLLSCVLAHAACFPKKSTQLILQYINHF